jgi:L-lactate dehydrogenase complex protein LldF
MYQGPIGAIVTPQLMGLDQAGSLPFASSLCGACAEVCPVKIDIPRILVHLRGRVVAARRAKSVLDGEALAMRAAQLVFGGAGRLGAAQSAARAGQTVFMRNGMISGLPGPLAGWTSARDFPPVAAESFRQWWARRTA